MYLISNPHVFFISNFTYNFIYLWNPQGTLFYNSLLDPWVCTWKPREHHGPGHSIWRCYLFREEKVTIREGGEHGCATCWRWEDTAIGTYWWLPLAWNANFLIQITGSIKVKLPSLRASLQFFLDGYLPGTLLSKRIHQGPMQLLELESLKSAISTMKELNCPLSIHKMGSLWSILFRPMIAPNEF